VFERIEKQKGREVFSRILLREKRKKKIVLD
jgi:hypothetical protein